MNIKYILDCITDLAVIIAFIIGWKALLYKGDEYTRKLYIENCLEIQTVLDRIIKNAIVTDDDINQLGIANQNAELYLDEETIKLTKEIHNLAIKIFAKFSKKEFDEDTIKILSGYKTKLLVKHYRKRMVFDFPKIKLNFLKFILIMVLLVNPAFAEWEKVGSDTYVDLNRISKYNKIYGQNYIYSVWTKSLDISSAEKLFGKRISYRLNMNLVNCQTRETAMKSFTIYENPNNVIWSGTEKDSELEWFPIVPNSIGQTIYNHVCLVPNAIEYFNTLKNN